MVLLNSVLKIVFVLHKTQFQATTTTIIITKTLHTIELFVLCFAIWNLRNCPTVWKSIHIGLLLKHKYMQMMTYDPLWNKCQYYVDTKHVYICIKPKKKEKKLKHTTVDVTYVCVCECDSKWENHCSMSKAELTQRQ